MPLPYAAVGEATLPAVKESSILGRVSQTSYFLLRRAFLFLAFRVGEDAEEISRYGREAACAEAEESYQSA